jgi:S1-C subfamily serine protease
VGNTGGVKPLRRIVVTAISLAVLTGVALLVTGFVRRSGSAATTSAKPAKAGIVVVDTTLGYEGGRAEGTGMVLTSNGEVLTNNHVIDGATSVRVVIPQTGRSYSVTVLGYDISADTALLKLRGASGVQTVTTGNSSSVRTGQTVRAVGNAGGTGVLTTVRGTVTGVGKTITASDDQGGSETLNGLIETNAALHPGDSGGPLLDGSGHVIGMNTATSRPGGGFFYTSSTSDSYSIPIAKALTIVKQIEVGQASPTVHIGATAFLGVDVTSADSGAGYPTQGAVIAGVVSGSPADRAGLMQGDEITGVASHAVTSPNTLRSLLLQRKPGDRVRLTWIDSLGSVQHATVTLAAGPAR